MKSPRAQENVVHQGAISVAEGQWSTRTKEVTMLTVRPAIVIRLGAIHSGTSVTNLGENLTHHIPLRRTLFLTSSNISALTDLEERHRRSCRHALAASLILYQLKYSSLRKS